MSARRLRVALDFGDDAERSVAQLGWDVTENERGWLAEIRDASDNSDPRLTGRSRTALRGIFGK